MRIPEDAIIPPERLTEYLLKPRDWDDKSQFLAQVGFSREKPEVLQHAIWRLAAAAEAVAENDYGAFYRVAGPLGGPLGALAVITVWLQWERDGTFHFVTLKPDRGMTP